MRMPYGRARGHFIQCGIERLFVIQVRHCSYRAVRWTGVTAISAAPRQRCPPNKHISNGGCALVLRTATRRAGILLYTARPHLPRHCGRVLLPNLNNALRLLWRAVTRTRQLAEPRITSIFDITRQDLNRFTLPNRGTFNSCNIASGHPRRCTFTAKRRYRRWNIYLDALKVTLFAGLCLVFQQYLGEAIAARTLCRG